jgi:hypothetical protein
MAGVALRNGALGALALIASVGAIYAGGSGYPGSPEPGAAGSSLQAQPGSTSEEAPQTSTAPVAPKRPAEADGVDLRRMIGQMLVVGFPGTAASDVWPSRAIGWVRDGKVGGVLLLGGNVRSPVSCGCSPAD